MWCSISYVVCDECGESVDLKGDYVATPVGAFGATEETHHHLSCYARLHSGVKPAPEFCDAVTEWLNRSTTKPSVHVSR